MATFCCEPFQGKRVKMGRRRVQYYFFLHLFSQGGHHAYTNCAEEINYNFICKRVKRHIVLLLYKYWEQAL